MNLNHKIFPLMSPQAKMKKIESNKELELADVHFHTMDNAGKSNNEYNENNDGNGEVTFPPMLVKIHPTAVFFCLKSQCETRFNINPFWHLLICTVLAFHHYVTLTPT